MIGNFPEVWNFNRFMCKYRSVLLSPAHSFINFFFYPHLVDVPLPAYVVEHMDADVKNVLFDIHERASIKRTSMVAARDKVNEPKPTTAQAEPATVTEDASAERGSFLYLPLPKKHIINLQCLGFEGNVANV